MDSFFARNRLSAYLDGDLQEPEASEVAAAIARDTDLRAEYENLRSSINLLRKTGPVKAPSGFHARIMEKIRDEPHPGGVVITLQRLFHRIPTEALALVAAAAVVLMVVQARSNNTPIDGTTPSTESIVQRTYPSPTSGPDDSTSDQHIAPVASALGPSAQDEPTSSNIRSYSLTSPDPDILHQIARILEGVGDETGMFEAAQDDSGPVALSPRMLNADDDFQRVFLALPTERQSSVTEALKKLDATYISGGLAMIDQGPMPSSSQAVYLVDVIYTPPL
jgi:negative regulator of sigma E activity